ncbi:MAG: hypothetical protein RRY97_00555 [Oscillibacter sp.]
METEFFTGHPQPYSRPLRQIAALIAGRSDDASCVAEISALLRQYGIAVDHG